MKKGLVMITMMVVLLLFSANLCAASNDIDYVGKDMDLKEGEMGIVSVGDDDDYVGKDMDLKEGEAGIISIEDPTDYVGKDLELEEGECGIISIDEGDADGSSRGFIPYVYGGAFLMLAASGIVVLRMKKAK